jgi:hypothetical protein
MADEKQGDRTQQSYGTPYHEDLLKEIAAGLEPIGEPLTQESRLLLTRH